MCGRYYLERTETLESLMEKYNRTDCKCKTESEIFPGDTVPVIASSRRLQPSIFAMRWGYCLNGKLIFNARSETASGKLLFQEGWRQHRCAIPASWYYEWNAKKWKYAISHRKGLLFFAGLYRMEEVPVFTVLTREPCEATAMIHPRMPVILPDEAVKAWIQPENPAEEIVRKAVLKLDVREVEKNV